MDAIDAVLSQDAADFEGFPDLCGCSLHILTDVIQGIFKKAAAVIQLYDKAALRILSVIDIAGVDIHLNGFGFRVHTQDTDVCKLLVEDAYQSLYTRSSGI